MVRPNAVRRSVLYAPISKQVNNFLSFKVTATKPKATFVVPLSTLCTEYFARDVHKLCMLVKLKQPSTKGTCKTSPVLTTEGT